MATQAEIENEITIQKVALEVDKRMKDVVIMSTDSKRLPIMYRKLYLTIDHDEASPMDMRQRVAENLRKALVRGICNGSA